jgi:hypothetical protein
MSQPPQSRIFVPGDAEDQPTEQHAPFPEWLKWLIGLGLAAIVSYFTSQARTDAAMARIEERENNHYSELKASIELLRQDIRELRPR